MTLTKVTAITLGNMDRCLLTGSEYLNIRKAFGTIDHDIMLKKISSFGIENFKASCFRNYLDNRISVSESTMKIQIISM